MSSFNFSLDLVQSDQDIAKKINKIILQELKPRLSKVFKESKNYIKTTVISAIKSQPEYNSLLSGSLKFEFGLPDSSSRINTILQTIETSLFVEYYNPKIIGRSINAGFFIGMVNSDFTDILSLSEATFISEKGTPLEWLKWLLLEGDKTIISGYEFNIGNFKNSRTGGGIMSSSMSGSWRVPPEFAGNLDNNWITRAIDSVSDQIENNLIGLMQNI